ncbi:MAG: o-succinylbenzoate synthase [Gammaproteobacteria bacterium]|nr:o-succinylbenzoate synthase [Gammaproteobacteria bacterium]MBU1654461.1 o-succinylbenzoate synthase [Gammaproteobacteria bacterium]MBU1962619.1 o-succinylbenzoate synthase [Gammaproteobacteria bacterium]
MLIQSSRFIPYRLPLRRPWISRHGRLDWREGWLVRLRAEGLEGIGDCAPLPEAGTETLAEAVSWLQRLIPATAGRDAAELLRRLDAGGPIPPAVRCGLETALLDLLSQRQGIGIARWLNPDAVAEVKVNANLGVLDDTVLDRLDEAGGCPVIKLKLGLAPAGAEIKRLRHLGERLPAGSRLRLDGNQAWGLEEALRLMDAVKELPIESIEEPLAVPHIPGLRRLQESSPIPITLDESLPRFDLDALLNNPPVRRICLKPMVLGGARVALRIARQAQGAGMETLVTTSVDSAVGVWTAVHLAAALGRAGTGMAHGLATSQWLAEDLARPPRIENGVVRLTKSGVIPNSSL